MEGNKQSRLRHFVAGPFIWVMIIPLIIFDIFIEIYHHICFPLYGISLVKRSRYIKIDRHKLQYLNWMEKICCAYCGYANGLTRYSSQIAGETEKYWCGIKHKKYADYIPPSHHKEFVEYGDEMAFKKRPPKEQKDITTCKKPFKLMFRNILQKIFHENFTQRYRSH